MESPSTEALKHAIKITQTPYHYRTLDETNALMAYLSRFDFFRNKVGDKGLEDVLQLASKYVKYTKIPAGEFLYHINQHSNHLFFILHGEAWKFRPSTEIEYQRDEAASKKSAKKETPKILQAIALAKASADRNKNPNLTLLKRQNSPPRKSMKAPDSPQKSQMSLLNLNSVDYSSNIKIDKTSSPTRKNQSQIKHRPEDMNKIKAGLLKKLKDTKDALNFENDYFLGLVNRNPAFSKLYMKEKVVTMKFDMKFNLYETIGEVSMSLTQVRTTSVLAYTDVHLFHLDQKNYERVFYAQLEAVQEKLTFFKDYFKDVTFENFKRLAFLFTEKKFNLGEVVYKEDEPSNNLYFIKSGEVQLFKAVKPPENVTPEFNSDLSIKCNFTNKLAKQVSVGGVPGGLFFGEESLLKQKKRFFTAKSVSNLHCYVIRNEVVSRFPLHVIYKLKEMSASKQNWIEDRLKNLQNLPLFKNIQRRLEHQNSPNELSANESHNPTEKISSFNNLPPEKSTQRESYISPPPSTYKRNDLAIKVSPNNPDYGVFNNVIQSFSTSYKSERPEDKTLRYYNPSFSPNTTKRKTFFPVSQSHPIKPKSQRGHRLISYESLKKIPRVGTSGHLSGIVSPNDRSRNTPKTKTRTNYKIKIDSESHIPTKTNLNQESEQKQVDIMPDTLIHLDNGEEEDFNFNFVRKNNNTKTENILSIIENPLPPETTQQKALEDKLKRLSVFSSMKRAKPEIHSQGASVERNDHQTLISVTNKSFRLPTSPSMEKKFVMYLSQKHFLSPIQKTAAADSCNSIEDPNSNSNSKLSSPKFDLTSSVLKHDSRYLDGSFIRETSFLIKKKPILMLSEKRSKGVV